VFVERVDDLIEAGRRVVETEFDFAAYLNWKEKVSDFLNDFGVPERIHPDTDSNCGSKFIFGLEGPYGSKMRGDLA
jgi:hypothetical protein